MGYILLINVVYWGYNPFTIHLPTSWDIQAWPIMFLPEPAIFNPPLVTPKGLKLNTYDVMFWDTPGQTISNDLSLCQLNELTLPIPSMYGIFTYIRLIFMVNVDKCTMHGSYGVICGGFSKGHKAKMAKNILGLAELWSSLTDVAWYSLYQQICAQHSTNQICAMICDASLHPHAPCMEYVPIRH